MKDRYWIIVGFLSCVGIGYFVAFSLQYFYHDAIGTLIEWEKVLYGGFLLGCLFFVPLILFVLAGQIKNHESMEGVNIE